MMKAHGKTKIALAAEEKPEQEKVEHGTARQSLLLGLK